MLYQNIVLRAYGFLDGQELDLYPLVLSFLFVFKKNMSKKYYCRSYTGEVLVDHITKKIDGYFSANTWPHVNV